MPHARTLRKAREQVKIMVATGFSTHRIRSYLKKWALWWVMTSETWSFEELLHEFIKSCWDYSAATMQFSFFESLHYQAAGSSGLPEKVTIDKSGANRAGIDAINLQLIVLALLGYTLMQIQIRQIKYLNNIIEQDHRGIKRIAKPMMGFKAFHSAEATLAGIELCRMLKKNQHINSDNSTAFEQFYALAA